MTTITIIEKLSHDVRGLARINGKTTFIGGALPGEKVLFKYTRQKKGFDEGRTLSVLTPSADRVEPHCPHYTECGGCSLQHLNDNVQIQVKHDQVLDLFERVAHVQPQKMVAPLRGESAWHYRHKARLSVRYLEKKQAVVIGFRRRDQAQLIADLGTCSVLSSKITPLFQTLPALITSLDACRSIPQLEFAVGDDTLALIIRYMGDLTAADEVRLKAFAEEQGILLFLQLAGPDSVYLLHPSHKNAYLTYGLPDHDIQLRFHPTDFTQVNPDLNRRMVNQALAWLDLTSDDVMFDLFCGLGNFSLPMARYVKQVIGVEGSDAMVSRASMNAELNHIENAQFFCANLDDATSLSQLYAHPANKMLIDPPRTGALTLVQHIDYFKPLTHLLYISCDPATLARDTAILVHEKGYTLACAGVMDMFPHTAHVETMALFCKN